MKIGENTAKTPQIVKKLSVAYVLEKELRYSAGNTIFRKRHDIPLAEYRKKYRISYTMSYATSHTNRMQSYTNCANRFC